MFSGDNWFLIVILTLGITLVMAMVMFILLKIQMEKKQSLYVQELNKIELERMREHLESKMYEINYKLSEDNERWNKMNHLIYDSQKYNYNNLKRSDNEKVNVESFIDSAGLNLNDLEVRKQSVFVLTPFHKNEWETYESIKNVCNSISLDCKRGDEKHIEGDILPHILKSIIEARIVIVNINGRNPNVFYELGIAHALGKKTIIISKYGEELPFDVKAKRIILYKDLNGLKDELKNSLTKALI